MLPLLSSHAIKVAAFPTPVTPRHLQHLWRCALLSVKSRLLSSRRAVELVSQQQGSILIIETCWQKLFGNYFVVHSIHLGGKLFNSMTGRAWMLDAVSSSKGGRSFPGVFGKRWIEARRDWAASSLANRELTLDGWHIFDGNSNFVV